MNTVTAKITQHLLNDVCKYLGLSHLTVCGKSRDRDAAAARAIFCHLARQWGVPLMDIGAVINRHHSTVLYYIQNYDYKYRYDKYFRQSADAVTGHNFFKDS